MRICRYGDIEPMLVSAFKVPPNEFKAFSSKINTYKRAKNSILPKHCYGGRGNSTFYTKKEFNRLFLALHLSLRIGLKFEKIKELFDRADIESLFDNGEEILLSDCATLDFKILKKSAERAWLLE